MNRRADGQASLRQFIDPIIEIDRRDVHGFAILLRDEIHDELTRQLNIDPRVFGTAWTVACHTDSDDRWIP